MATPLSCCCRPFRLGDVVVWLSRHENGPKTHTLTQSTDENTQPLTRISQQHKPTRLWRGQVCAVGSSEEMLRTSMAEKTWTLRTF
jgi:hypothetical protein